MGRSDPLQREIQPLTHLARLDGDTPPRRVRAVPGLPEQVVPAGGNTMMALPLLPGLVHTAHLGGPWGTSRWAHDSRGQSDPDLTTGGGSREVDVCVPPVPKLGEQIPQDSPRPSAAHMLLDGLVVLAARRPAAKSRSTGPEPFEGSRAWCAATADVARVPMARIAAAAGGRGSTLSTAAPAPSPNSTKVDEFPPAAVDLRSAGEGP